MNTLLPRARDRASSPEAAAWLGRPEGVASPMTLAGLYAERNVRAPISSAEPPASVGLFHLLPEPLAFATGTRPELLIVDPVLSGALLVLAGWVADPAFVAAHWHSLTR
jgi:hypothetical protein